MRQLTGVDASFLTWENNTTVGHVTSVLILNPSTSPEPWTLDRLSRLLQARLYRVAPLRQKLVEVPLGLDRPYWVEDPDFDLENHLHHVAVPGGGDREQFSALVARIHERPLDRRRPLWECHLVEGVHGDSLAVITKIHHAAIDGISGQEILTELVDLDPRAPIERANDRQAKPLAVDRIDSGEVLARAALSLLSSPARMVRAGITLGKALPVLGPAIGRAAPVARGDESTRELLRRFGTAPRTPFNATIGPHRRWAYVSLPLDEVKAVKNAAGTTVNDVVLAMVAGALRSWLIDQDALPDRPLAAMVPLSVRREGEQNAIGNHISSTISTLATHIEDPAERLATIKASMDKAKAQQNALPADILTDLSQVAPPAIAALAARLVASTKLADRVSLPFNLVVSNVPGPPIPLYLAGALITANFPVSAIVDGVGLNVTVVSTNGTLDVGYVADRDLLPDLWNLADRTGPALAELAAAVGVDD